MFRYLKKKEKRKKEMSDFAIVTPHSSNFVERKPITTPVLRAMTVLTNCP